MAVVKYGIERKAPGGIFTEIAEVEDALTYTDVMAPVGELSYRVRKKSPFSPYSSTVTVTATSAIDPDAQIWIDRLTSPSETEQNAINTFVIAEKDAGNWSLYDEFYCFCLGATNSFVAAKSKTATGFGGLTLSSNGAVLNGTNAYINLDFDTSVDSVNYDLDNMLTSVFVYDKTTATGERFVISGGESSIKLRLGFNDGIMATRSSTNSFNNDMIPIADWDSKLLSLSRSSSTEASLIENGVTIDTNTIVSQSIPVGDIFLGANNNNGSPASFSNVTISTFLIGASIGFDDTAHNTNVRQFLTDLGVSI